MAGIVQRERALQRVAADAVEGEHRLDQDGAAEHEAEHDADEGEDGSDRDASEPVGRGGAPWPLGDPRGLRVEHVVALFERGDTRALPGHPDDRPAQHEGEGEDRGARGARAPRPEDVGLTPRAELSIRMKCVTCGGGVLDRD